MVLGQKKSTILYFFFVGEDSGRYPIFLLGLRCLFAAVSGIIK